MLAEEIVKYCRCCACGGPLTGIPTMVQVPVTITWGFPKWGNFITGAKDQGVAYICDPCQDKPGFGYTDVKNVVEFYSGTNVRYHSIIWHRGQNDRLTAQLT